MLTYVPVCCTLVSMAGGTDTVRDGVDSGLSQLAARILGQLSLSAWLPGALLAFLGTLIVTFAHQGRVDLPGALSLLLQDKWAAILMILPTLVLATLTTQAFSFEAIRALEGYWHRRGPVRWVQRLMITRKLERKRRVRQQRLSLSHQAFIASRPIWLKENFSPAIVDALELASLEEDNSEVKKRMTSDDTRIFEHLNWRTRCSPVDMARIYYLARAEEDFPADHRMLPTRLGNVMRATEDRLSAGADDIESYALRRRQHATPRVQLQHDQFRTRLDMYCTLVFVAALLSVFTVAVLGVSFVRRDNVPSTEIAWSACIVLALAMLAWTSYQAAIASARGYLAALTQMGERYKPGGS